MWSFIRPMKGLLPQMIGEPIIVNNDDAQYEAIKVCQRKYIKNIDTVFAVGSTVAVQWEDGGPWMHRFIE